MCSSLMSVIHFHLLFFIYWVQNLYLDSYIFHVAIHYFTTICCEKSYFLHCFTFVPLLQIIWVNLICSILTCYFFLSSLLTYSFICIVVSGPLKLYSNTLKWVNFRLSFNIMLLIFFRYSIFQYWWNILVFCLRLHLM